MSEAKKFLSQNNLNFNNEIFFSEIIDNDYF